MNRVSVNMADKECNSGADRASGSEASDVAELLLVLMDKIDMQAQSQIQKMDAQAQEFREVGQSSLEFISNKARQFAEKAELLQQVHEVRAGAQEIREEMATLDMM